MTTNFSIAFGYLPNYWTPSCVRASFVRVKYHNNFIVLILILLLICHSNAKLDIFYSSKINLFIFVPRLFYVRHEHTCMNYCWIVAFFNKISFYLPLFKTKTHDTKRASFDLCSLIAENVLLVHTIKKSEYTESCTPICSIYCLKGR